MSAPPRAKSINRSDSVNRPVLGPAGNNPTEKLKRNYKAESDGKKSQPIPPPPAGAGDDPSPKPRFPVAESKKGGKFSSVLRQRRPEQRSFPMRSNLSMNASCSSDASSDSSQSKSSSSGNISIDNVTPKFARRKQCGLKTTSEVESLSMNSDDFPLVKKTCAWVTTTTDPLYVAFHDEEWGVPVHDDRNLFELLSLCTALAELTWPTILNRRQAFREVFYNLDPVAVSKLNEKKIVAPGNPASSLLSELKLRVIIENARQVCKIIDEFGSFDKYIWGFVNHKPIVGQNRYQRQVPIKTSKAESISKDLVRRGFRGVGPTVIYSFMQVSGIVNDHLIGCFRFQECIPGGDARNRVDKIKLKQTGDDTELELVRDIDNLNIPCTN